MPTFYKPTQRQGKRVIYQSIDPAEPRRRKFALIVIGCVMAVTLVIELIIQLSN